ncbi:hypothetical protein JL722_11691 [Aureococcus anophagefferens]|nr:hypothetical protein JL722_11691 [Aureococcus anophagefferens]
MAAGPLFLSQEAERTLKQCHGIRAGPDGRVLLHRAAEEAQQYGLWDHADLSERGAAAASETRARTALLTPPPLARRPVAPRRAAAHARARGHDALRELRRVRRARAARARRASPRAAAEHPRGGAVQVLGQVQEHARGDQPHRRLARRRRAGHAARAEPARGSGFRGAALVAAAGAVAAGARYWEAKVAERTEYVADRLARKRKQVADDEAPRAGSGAARAAASACKAALTPEELRRVRDAVNADDRDVVVDHFNYEVCGEHARRLGPGEWLVDEVVNYYFAMLQQRDAALVADEGEKPSHFFNSFFIPKLMGTDARSYNYAGVKRWTKKFDLFSRKRVFAPVNVGNMHWCLIMVDFELQQVRYFDSMGGGGDAYLRAMIQYLKDEHLAKKGAPLPGDWQPVRTTDDTPRQLNGYDCGVFATFCAHYASLGAPLDFSQADIPHFRDRMMIDILDKKLYSAE